MKKSNQLLRDGGGDSILAYLETWGFDARPLTRDEAYKLAHDLCNLFENRHSDESRSKLESPEWREIMESFKLIERAMAVPADVRHVLHFLLRPDGSLNPPPSKKAP